MSKRDPGQDPPSDLFGYLRAPGGAVGRNEAEKSPQQAREDLARFLRQFSFKSVCVACAGVSALRATNEKDFSEGLAELGLDSLTEFRSFLMRLVVDAAAHACPDDDVMGGDMKPSDLMHALRLAEHVSSRSDQSQNEGDVPFAIMRLMQNQIHDLIGYSYMAREIYLTLDTVERALSKGLDINGRFRETYGVTYRELVAGCVGLWARVLRPSEGGFLIPKRAIGSHGPGNTLEQVLDVISADRTRLVDCQRQLAVDGYETYSLSALKKYPVVILSDGLRVAPVANDVVDRSFRGFFYDVRSMLSDAEFGVFGDASGAAYQDLIEETLKACCGAESVLRAEEVVERHEGEKVCDFICVERGHLTLVEVKSARPPMRTEVTKEPESLREYVLRKGSIADAVEQIATTARAVKAKGRTRVPKRQRVVGLVVTPGERVGINSSFVRKVVREHLSETAAKGFEKYLICDDLGFSVLIGSLGQSPGLGQLLWRLTTDKAHKFNDVHTQLDYRDFGAHPLQERFRGVLRPLFAQP